MVPKGTYAGHATQCYCQQGIESRMPHLWDYPTAQAVIRQVQLGVDEATQVSTAGATAATPVMAGPPGTTAEVPQVPAAHIAAVSGLRVTTSI